MRQVANPLIYALLASAAIAIALGELEDGLVVAAVVVLNTLIGFVQEFRAGRAIAALVELVAEPATVQRDGHWVRVSADEVVPGDLVALAAGDRVPADVRLLRADALRTQEAALTGESVPIAKDAAPVEPRRRSPSVAACSTPARRSPPGQGAAWRSPPVRRPSSDASPPCCRRSTSCTTPLTVELDRVGRVITLLIAVAAVVLVLVATVRGFPLADAALAGISLAVAAVPEGLPAVVTIALAIGVQRMARRRAIIRHLPAVETLGSTTVVASDKTGTLTRNEMTVQAVWTPGDASASTPPPAPRRRTSSSCCARACFATTRR